MVISILLLTSCKNFLEEDMKSNLPLSAVSGKSLIVASYDELGAVISRQRAWYLMTEVASDHALFFTTNATRRSLMNFTFHMGTGEIPTAWDGFFKSIAYANNVIEQLKVSDLPEEEKQQTLAEARFLRGMNYFILVRFWGKLPIYEKPVATGDVQIPRSEIKDVYEFLMKDLRFAEKHLPVKYLGGDRGRATSGAAKAVLAKVFLTRASQQKYGYPYDAGVQVTDYDSAQVYLWKVKKMGYSLASAYANNFDINTEFGPESIFDINCTVHAKYVNLNRGPADWGTNPNIYGGATYEQVALTQDLYDRFETKDTRRSMLVRGTYSTTTGITRTIPTYTNPKKEVYTDGLIFSWKMTDSQYPDADGDKKGSYPLGGVNYPMIRYADVLLMLAEIKMEKGQLDSAKYYVNLVRSRANATPVVTISSIDEILDERSREFYLEGHRWFDLVRTGRLKTYVEKTALREAVHHYDANSGKVTVEYPKHYLFPIIKREYDLGLGQNPGY